MNNIEKLILDDQKVTLIDVREVSELINQGSVPNAINIQLNEIKNRIQEIKKMKKPLILFCKSGNRSRQAINILEKQGLKDLHNGMSFKSILEILSKKK